MILIYWSGRTGTKNRGVKWQEGELLDIRCNDQMITSDNGAPATAVPDWAADWLVLSARSISDVDVDTAHTGRSAKWEAWKKDGLVSWA